MTVILEIDDGAAVWWESPDIWVVPGPDPLGGPGTPITGGAAYVWARVHNRGDHDVQAAYVKFWWSNPSIGVTRTLSTLIGTAFVDVAAGATEEVLCLSPWVPSFVNGGHECLVCEVVSPADPLPVPVPDLFDPPTFRQIAQRNLSVLELAPMVMSVQLALGKRSHRREAALKVEVGGELDRMTLESMGLTKLSPALQPLVHVGLADSGACDSEHGPGLHVAIGDGGIAGAYLHIRPIEKASSEPGTYSVIRVRDDEQPDGGGITFVVRDTRSEKGGRRG
jgi:hypothetical protein